MPAAEFPSSCSTTKKCNQLHNSHDHTEGCTHAYFSEETKLFLALDPRRISHCIEDTSLSTQDRLRMLSMGLLEN